MTAQKFNPSVTTYEGGQAYVTDLEFNLCTIFTLGCHNGEFYEDAQTAVNKANDVLTTALNTCPELATKYAVYAAETLRMKLMPTVWLVYLSTLQDKTLFKKAFPRIINKNIKLLFDFIEICRNTTIRPGGHMKQKIKNNNRGVGSGIKKVINNYLYEIMNDYNVTRFTGKLEDICHVTRIKDTESSKKYLDYIFKPKNSDRRLTFDRARYLDETIKILQLPAQGIEITEAQLNMVMEYIQKYKIQMDEIKFTFGSLPEFILKAVYTFFVPTLSYAALIINLVAIERVWATSTRIINRTRQGAQYAAKEVLETNVPQELVDIVSKKIMNIDAYKRSGLFFMRLFAASRMIKTSAWIKALNSVFETVAKEVFKEIPNDMRVRVSADTSGSMTTTINGSSVTAGEVAAYFTAACAISIPNTKAFATATITKEVPIVTNNITVEANNIMRTDTGYGTNFSTLLKHYNGENIVLLITDTQQSDNVERAWQKLANKSANAKFIIWDVVGYLHNNCISKDPTMLYIHGYSDSTISLVSNLILGKAGQTDVVKTVQL